MWLATAERVAAALLISMCWRPEYRGITDADFKYEQGAAVTHLKVLTVSCGICAIHIQPAISSSWWRTPNVCIVFSVKRKEKQRLVYDMDPI